MISDYSVPPGFEPAEIRERSAPPIYLSGHWTAPEVRRLAVHLADRGTSTLAALTDETLLDAWNGALQALLEAAFPERQALDPLLVETCRLTPASLQAALEAVLDGMRGEPARRLAERARSLERRRDGLVTAILSSNVPGLGVQVLLPALLLRRPVLLKSSSREPLLGAALVHLLGTAEPALAESMAALSWRGGNEAIDTEAFAEAAAVVAFGTDGTLSAIDERRTAFEQTDLVGHGTMISLALVSKEVVPKGVVSSDADLDAVAAGLAEDATLIEQRGCLSVRAVLTDADEQTLCEALAGALRRQARRWPPFPLEPARAGALRLARSEAELRGHAVVDLPLEVGTVIAQHGGPLAPLLPAGRSLRIHRVDALQEALTLLEPWQGRLQGVAIAGERAERLRPRLEALGVRRITPPGHLQRTDALWANGERHLIERLA